MLGLREPLVLDREHYPTQRQPQLPGRLGIGPAVPRSYAGAPLIERWSQTIAVGHWINAGTTEASYSNWLHQVMLIRGITYQNDNPQTAQNYWQLIATSEVIATPMAALRGTAGPVDSYNPDSLQKLIRAEQMYTRVQPGTIIRNVPTKLCLIEHNGSGAHSYTTLFVDVTFLAPAPNPGNPGPDCQSCPHGRT